MDSLPVVGTELTVTELTVKAVKWSLLLMLLELAACSSDFPELSLREVKGSVDLSRQVQGNWDRACILTPKTTPQQGSAVTGLPTSIIVQSGISANDSFNVLFFLKAGQVFSAYRVPLEKIQFADLQPRCFERSQAVLDTR